MEITKRIGVLIGLGVVFLAGSFVFLSSQTSKSAAYKRAKKVMDPDLYLVYRLSERILQSNSINRPLRLAVRRGASCTTKNLAAGTDACAVAQLLPDIDKATNFDIWAAQVVNTMAGTANAGAMSRSGTIFVNTPLLKEMMGRPNQLACVIAHELAHVTQNHQEEEAKKSAEQAVIAAKRITAKTKRLHGKQNTGYAMAAVFSGLAAGYSGDNSSINLLSNQIALNNLASQIAEPQITAMAMEYSPEIGTAINTMKGLSPRYLKSATKYVNSYLRDASLALMAFNRGQEYEADLLGLNYMAAAGFNPEACVKLWEETMPHNTNKIVARLLPEGIEDPGKSADPSIFINKEDIGEEKKSDTAACTGLFRYDCQQARKKRKNKKNPEKVSQEVLDLLSTHPSDERRAKAIKKHLHESVDLFKQLRKSGKESMNIENMRDWKYDKESESVVISDILKAPKDVGREKTGTTGIDIDEFLDS